MSEPSYDELRRMQREAEHRIREMKRRAERAVSGEDLPPIPNFVKINPDRGRPGHVPPQNTPERPGAPGNGASPRNTGHSADAHGSEGRQSGSAERRPHTGGLLGRGRGFDLLKMFNFKGRKLDSDVILIVVLICLLSTEETDELLLLALLYIML